MRVRFVAAPADYLTTLGPLPPGVRVLQRHAADTAVIQLFVTRRASLHKQLATLKTQMPRDGALWISWPKKTSGMATEVAEAEVREAGLAAGLVDVKICAVDATWSALKFVVRLADR